MIARAACAALLCLAASLLPCATAAAVDLEDFDVTFAKQGGEVEMGAGEHPSELTVSFEVARKEIEGKPFPVEAVKDLTVAQVPGLAGIPVATPRCSAAEFLKEPPEGEEGVTSCADSAAVGTVAAEVGEAGEVEETFAAAVYNMQPSPGYVAKFGFRLGSVYVTVDLGLSESPPYRILATLRNISQALEFFSSKFTIWGNPAATVHDPFRGKCLAGVAPGGELQSTGECPTDAPEVPFLVNPRACEGPLATLWQTTSWQNPSLPPATGQVLTHGASGAQRGFSGCGELSFAPSISAQPTARAATSPSGLDFGLDVPDPGLLNPDGLAAADIERTVVALPEGMSVNPSQAEGLEVCTEAQLAGETASSGPGEGCPEASKIGTLEVETPLLPEELFKGSLFVAEPYANPTGSLIAVYAVIKDPELGIKIVQPIEVAPDPASGRLISTAEGMPQLPFSHFRLHFREGGRAPLISPPGCGTFDTAATLYPYSGGAPVASTSTFQIVSGPSNSPCPAGAAPFDPGFEAGTLNNAAGRYSPFDMRITRGDAEQDLTRFSAVLPPGVLGRIAGIPWCPEAAVARAKSRTGPHGGTEELADPSCPAASQVGRTLAGAGVGSQLTYVPGSLYLAGPYHGAPLSVVSITPAVAGPFDAGTVVVREALSLNPITAEVQVDGAASDPIPHILKGIPLNVRDLRVYAERPGFTLNATSCAPSLARATLWGAGTVLAPTPEAPVARAARYQAAGCASLGFKPKLGIKLKGGTRRGAHPALRAVVTPRPLRDANFSRAVVTLPHSAFLDQAHIRTVCTRVQFAAGAGHGAACPPGAVYGRARAWSPLLAQPLAGPVYLRSSNNKLPDLIVALHGLFDLELGARIDSKKGGIRAAFTPIPDAPVSRFILDMRGGKKGLIVNSKNLCRKQKANRAKANLRGQNGKRRTLKPVVRAVKCKHKRKRGNKKGKHAQGNKRGKGKRGGGRR